MTSPANLTSSITLLIRSSNSPRYLVPEIIEERSKETTRLPFNKSGISSDAIFCAKPSTTAVLPTPGSPTKQGLFLVLLERI